MKKRRTKRTITAKERREIKAFAAEISEKLDDILDVSYEMVTRISPTKLGKPAQKWYNNLLMVNKQLRLIRSKITW